MRFVKGIVCCDCYPCHVECLVGAGCEPAPIVSLLFVHTARRFSRLDTLVNAMPILDKARLLAFRNIKCLEGGKVVTRFP